MAGYSLGPPDVADGLAAAVTVTVTYWTLTLGQTSDAAEGRAVGKADAAVAGEDETAVAAAEDA